MKVSNIIYVFIFFFIPISVSAQGLSYETYINNVKENNISYIAEKYNVDIANANVQAARVFNNPDASFSYSDNQDAKMQMGQSYEGELEYVISLGNARGARIDVARAEKDLTNAALSDYFRNLKADAALCYYNALKQKEYMTLMRSSYKQMSQIAASDSLRLVHGELTATDAMQSHLEALTAYNDYLKSKANYRNALTDMVFMMGKKDMVLPDSLSETFHFTEQIFDIDELYEQAINNRSDLQVAILSKTLSEKNLRLVKANRAMELGLNVGFAHNTIAENEIAPAPVYNSISVGASIPLKFSNFNRGEVQAADFAVKQSETNIEAANMQIYNEVTQAYNNYIIAAEIAKRFSTSMMENASDILKNKTFGYQHGETSLLEVLNARRTYNDVCTSYYEAIYNAIAALIEIEKAVGK